MYLTGGQYKGHKIDVPKNTRPTLSKVRESIFNMLIGFNLNGNKFLDMFAGSGIMGLEAISRGYCVKEIEINAKTAKIIKDNYAKIKTKPDIIISDALKYTGEKFDIIYIDPPWQNDYKPIINKAQELINDNGVVIIEYDKQINLNIKQLIKDTDFSIIKEKKYGRCLITILKIVE